MPQTVIFTAFGNALEWKTDIKIFLHGALENASRWEELIPNLNHYGIAVNLSGHGELPLQSPDFDVDHLVIELRDRLKKSYSDSTFSMIGYSLGGFVAARWAVLFPGEISQIQTLATRWLWPEDFMQKETGKLNPEKLQQFAPAFFEKLKTRHKYLSPERMLELTSDMMRSISARFPEPERWLSAIDIPVHIISGDRDPMAHAEQSLQAFRCLKHPVSSLHILPGVKHDLATFPLTELLAKSPLAGKL